MRYLIYKNLLTNDKYLKKVKYYENIDKYF